MIQSHVRAFLAGGDHRSQARAISVCAGEGRDLLDVLAERPDRAAIAARLVELDPVLAERAREAAVAHGLERVEVVRRDAGVTDAYAGAAPADLVLLCGIFGNVADADVRRTIAALPQLCAAGATVIWTRHRRAPDLTPRIRAWFAEHGFSERAFESPGPDAWSVGVQEFIGRPVPLAPGERLFTFVR